MVLHLIPFAKGPGFETFLTFAQYRNPSIALRAYFAVIYTSGRDRCPEEEGTET